MNTTHNTRSEREPRRNMPCAAGATFREAGADELAAVAGGDTFTQVIIQSYYSYWRWWTALSFSNVSGF
jgi:hypothetical protein